jgi:uncharacterized protein (DUF2237 family)
VTRPDQRCLLPCAAMSEPRNVLGGPLHPCSKDPVTGYFRDGSCRTCEEDRGVHTVCARVTEEFLSFSRANGNDLSTPVPQFGFPGLRPGDRWCLCAGRWKQALDAGMAPPVILESTHEATLEVVSLAELQEHAIPALRVVKA